jgi:hypothetical protein
MEGAGRSGIVWQKESGDHRLYTAQDVVIGIAAGVLTLVDIHGIHVERAGPEPPDKRTEIFKSDLLLQSRAFVVEPEMFEKLLVKAVQCYCRTCGAPGAKGKPCAVDDGTVDCK